MNPVCDWLDVTYAPGTAPVSSVAAVLNESGGECLAASDAGVLYRVGEGILKVDRKKQWERISASGGVLATLRCAGKFLDYLSALSDAPHTVTRLDAALDVEEDAPPIIAKLFERYPQTCPLGRKGVEVQMQLATRPDGARTGTFYAGHRQQVKASARVYDKQWEMLRKHGAEIPPRTRYEVTARREMGVTLRDAAHPDGIFWHIASPALLDAPANVEPWYPHGEGWVAPPRDPLPPGQVLIRRVSESSELASLVELADRCGPEGRQLLLGEIRRRLFPQPRDKAA